ncbi:hypothetical protein THF5G08_30075 [Vibrio jasicida]|nr:hypothetical protein THF5G08_30075 [Vibrio jasicida]
MPIKVVAPLREASLTQPANLGDPYPYHSPNKKDPFVPRVFLFLKRQNKQVKYQTLYSCLMLVQVNQLQ